MSNARTLAGLIDGSNIVVPSGYGLDFGASTDGTGTVKPTVGGILDDYEEGTWTPTVIGSLTSGTYTSGSNYGNYRKIGDMVTVWASFINISGSGGAGSLQVDGLPFKISAIHGQGPISSPRIRQTTTTRSNFICIGLANQTKVLIQYDVNGDGSGSDLPITDINSGNTDYSFNFSYIASAS